MARKKTYQNLKTTIILNYFFYYFIK